MAAIDNGDWTPHKKEVAFLDKTDTGSSFPSRLLVEEERDNSTKSVLVIPEDGPIRLNVSDARDLRDWLDRFVTENKWQIEEER